jgi:hypothetical protein
MTTLKVKVELAGNVLHINEDTMVNLANVVTLRKYFKNKATTKKYAIGVASLPSQDGGCGWQFIFETDNENERDEVYSTIFDLFKEFKKEI